jgi:hypothetical protein
MFTMRSWAFLLHFLACAAFSDNSIAQGLNLGLDHPNVQSRDAPLQVAAGIEIHQITFVDQKSENFGVVATIRMRWKDSAFAFDENAYGQDYRLMTGQSFNKSANALPTTIPIFVIENQQGRRIEHESLVNISSNGEITYFERSSFTLQAPYFDFKKYPFDTQKFFLEIVSINPVKLVQFTTLDEHYGLGDNLGEEEWVLENPQLEISTITGLTGLESSKVALVFTGHRHIEYYTLRIFIPLLVLIIVSWATFFLGEYRKRIEIAGANLLVFIAFNFAISGDLPKLGYPTFMDFILLCMFVITGSIIGFNVALRRLNVAGKESLALRIDNYVSKWIYPLGYLAVVGFAIYRFLL